VRHVGHHFGPITGELLARHRWHMSRLYSYRPFIFEPIHRGGGGVETSSRIRRFGHLRPRPPDPLFIATRAAADADATAAALWEARKSERLHGMHDFAAHLADTGELRRTLTTDDTRDRLFALASPEVYGLLVLELGWLPERYTTWLTELLAQQLLR